MSAMSDVRRGVAEVNDLPCSVNLLTWDARTQMPAAAAPARGKPRSTLSKVAKERLFSGELEIEPYLAYLQEKYRKLCRL